jgi:SnoaL-like domain
MKSIEEEFAERFAEVWKNPSVEKLVTLLHADVVLYQPHLPVMHGRAAAGEEFQRLLQWLPDFHGDVERFRGSDGVVFIEWRMMFPIGKRGVSIPAVDRFILEDGVAIERVVYFNQLPLVIAILSHPGVWRGFRKYRFGRS